MPFWDKEVAPQYKQLPTMSGGQQDLFNQLLQMLGGQGGGMGQGMDYLKGILSGSPESQRAFEAPYMRQFNEEIVPGIAERFAGVGGQRSSALGQELGSAGAGLQEMLASMREQQKSGAMGQLMGMLGMGVQTPTFQGMYTPGHTQQGWGTSLLGSLGAGAGMALGGGMGGAGLDWIKKLFAPKV